MAAGKTVTSNALTWGDLVRVKDDAPTEFPRALASVCGLGTVEVGSVFAQRGWPVGSAFVTAEFADGSSVEIPEQYLELVERNGGV